MVYHDIILRPIELETFVMSPKRSAGQASEDDKYQRCIVGSGGGRGAAGGCRGLAPWRGGQWPGDTGVVRG